MPLRRRTSHRDCICTRCKACASARKKNPIQLACMCIRLQPILQFPDVVRGKKVKKALAWWTATGAAGNDAHANVARPIFHSLYEVSSAALNCSGCRFGHALSRKSSYGKRRLDLRPKTLQPVSANLRHFDLPLFQILTVTLRLCMQHAWLEPLRKTETLTDGRERIFTATIYFQNREGSRHCFGETEAESRHEHQAHA